MLEIQKYFKEKNAWTQLAAPFFLYTLSAHKIDRY